MALSFKFKDIPDTMDKITKDSDYPLYIKEAAIDLKITSLKFQLAIYKWEREMKGKINES